MLPDMSTEPALRDDLDLSYTAADEARDEASMAAMDRGEFITHEAVSAWLLSKDTDRPLPRPRVGD